MEIVITASEKHAIKVEKVFKNQYEIKHNGLTFLLDKELLQELKWEIKKFPELEEEE